MPTYNHKDLNVFIADALSPRLTISALLSNVVSFHVRLFNIKQEGVLFAVSSPDYVLSAETFRRDGDADADRKAPFGTRDQRARIARHRVPLSF
jgi:hypothetical protein